MNPKSRFPVVAIVAIAVIAIAVAGWFAFSRFRGRSETPVPRVAVPRYDTVGERESTTTVSEIRGPDEPAPNVNTKVNESQAIVILGSFLMKRDFYGVPSSCLAVRSQGFDGRRYTLEVANRCQADGAAPRFLGRWRVDSTTRDVFHQREDGRYVRP